MELIHETSDEAKDAALGSPPNNTKKNLVKEAENEDQDDDDDDDDDYEDDNDFEPFETSKKDFYQADSQESQKNAAAESEAKSQHDLADRRQTPPTS